VHFSRPTSTLLLLLLLLDVFWPTRDARKHWTAENHLYNLLHRGYTSEPKGHATCPFDFYK
jgi:hypothetical protein